MLDKLEQLFSEQEYTIRYEKGHFNSGYCLVENKKIAVINKFFDTEARINVLLDILSNIPVDEQLMSKESLTIFRQMLKEIQVENSGE